MTLPPHLERYAIGLVSEALGVYLALHPKKLGRIGFGTPGGAVPREIPPLPRWVGLFIAVELLCLGTGILAWSALGHPASVEALFTIAGAFFFLLTMAGISLIAGLSARQHPGFTAKTVSRVRSYRITAFVYAAVAIGLLFLVFVFPLVRHR
jgi:hypothetical protein